MLQSLDASGKTSMPNTSIMLLVMKLASWGTEAASIASASVSMATVSMVTRRSADGDDEL